MLQPFYKLRFTLKAACTAPHRLTLRPDGLCPANRAAIRKLKGLSVCLSIAAHNPHNLRNNITGALDDHLIACTDIKAAYLIFIMQGGVGYHHPAHRYRFQPCDRGQRACAAHLNINRLQGGFHLLSGEFMGNGPTRRPAYLSQPHLQLMVIDLIDHTINIIAKAGPLFADLFISRQQSIGIRT